MKPDIDTLQWAKAAGIRTVKTMTQIAVVAIGTATAMGAVDWKLVASTSVLSVILSVLTGVAGIPEAQQQ